jgi:2-polyprenyl-3-methyl-5-hydroxy-6-metoxy-1,4-benzoquinol methylase
MKPYMGMPRWFIDELAHAGREHLDPAYVPAYDQEAATDPGEDLVLQDLDLHQSHTLVDFGAGTGTFALAAAGLCRRVVAVDVSREMLSVRRPISTPAAPLDLRHLQHL